ncbi:MAG: polyprenyl synthetase family protein [Bacteroidales bacterium]|jgi:geranylgeranyl diphosphate synthase type II|nr:polyprenyl synthetase family protein [Bacteroidales bacterium]
MKSNDYHTIKELQDIFIEHLNRQNFLSNPKELYEPIVYTMNIGGKRIRPVLLLMTCEIFGGDYRKALDSAVGLEVFHNFTLVHDDIMDNASIRRGQETVFKKWNANIGILSGDAMFAIAFDYMMRVDDKIIRKAIQLFDKTAIEVCEGQQLDLNFETSKHVSIADYFDMIRLKTGVLIAAALKMGAIIAEADDRQTEIIYDFGIHIGLTFQLIDDYLDLFSHDMKFGKARGGDILANKKTYLYIKGYELADAKEKAQLDALFANKEIAPRDKIEQVSAIWQSLGVPEAACEDIKQYHAKAMQLLDKLDVPKERISELRYYANELLERTY